MGEKFGPCGEWGSSIITTPIMVEEVLWGYWTPYPLLLGKELRNPSVTVHKGLG